MQIDINELVNEINTKANLLNNKTWTLENVYDVITNKFEMLENRPEVEYNCIRTAIISRLSSSYERDISQSYLLKEIWDHVGPLPILSLI